MIKYILEFSWNNIIHHDYKDKIGPLKVKAIPKNDITIKFYFMLKNVKNKHILDFFINYNNIILYLKIYLIILNFYINCKSISIIKNMCGVSHCNNVILHLRIYLIIISENHYYDTKKMRHLIYLLII